MLKKLFWLLMMVVVGIPLIALTLSNRNPVELSLAHLKTLTFEMFPFIPDTLSLPFWYYLFAALIAGILVGGFATWVSQGRWRKAARQRTREAHEWRAKSDQFAQQLKLAQQEFNDYKQKELDARQAGGSPQNAPSQAPRLTASS